jgi:3-oxoacyl-(acyl-carrier-protein) synthase
MMPRVVVTGAGVLSPLGNSVDTFWDALSSGATGIRLNSELGVDYGTGWVDFDLSANFSRAQINTLDRVGLLAIAAANQAVLQSGLDMETPFGSEVGVYFGTGMGGADSTEQSYAKYFGAGGERKKLLTVPAAMVHAAASQIALRFGVTGECQTYSTACSSSTVAIGEAYRRIRDGYMQKALAGGAECLLVPGVLDAWKAMHVLCEDPVDALGTGCRPFSADRSGFAIGEGAAIFVLETLASATARGAIPLCEIVGYGVSNDASHITKPNPQGQAMALKNAIANAGLTPEKIQHINAHGTATQAGDIAETQSIKLVFGEHAKKIAISATKSSHGHLMGATGAVEFLATAIALQKQFVPPTAHWTVQDLECDLDYVPSKGRSAPGLQFAMTNSFAFGGNNAVLVLKRWDT